MKGTARTICMALAVLLLACGCCTVELQELQKPHEHPQAPREYRPAETERHGGIWLVVHPEPVIMKQLKVMKVDSSYVIQTTVI